MPTVRPSGNSKIILLLMAAYGIRRHLHWASANRLAKLTIAVLPSTGDQHPNGRPAGWTYIPPMYMTPVTLLLPIMTWSAVATFHRVSGFDSSLLCSSSYLFYTFYIIYLLSTYHVFSSVLYTLLNFTCGEKLAKYLLTTIIFERLMSNGCLLSVPLL